MFYGKLSEDQST